MAIAPICDYCKTELVELGAIVLSPPTREGKVYKYHACKQCYKQLEPKDE